MTLALAGGISSLASHLDEAPRQAEPPWRCAEQKLSFVPKIGAYILKAAVREAILSWWPETTVGRNRSIMTTTPLDNDVLILRVKNIPNHYSISLNFVDWRSGGPMSCNSFDMSFESWYHKLLKSAVQLMPYWTRNKAVPNKAGVFGLS